MGLSPDSVLRSLHFLPLAERERRFPVRHVVPPKVETLATETPFGCAAAARGTLHPGASVPCALAAAPSKPNGQTPALPECAGRPPAPATTTGRCATAWRPLPVLASSYPVKSPEPPPHPRKPATSPGSNC